jgi:hypothetical protein
MLQTWMMPRTCNNEYRMDLRTTPFWAITQRVVVISYGRFGTTYRSHLQGSRIRKETMVQKVYVQETFFLCCVTVRRFRSAFFIRPIKDGDLLD